jgi:predicted PhzF superfamily epimerase YddE/YHI9
VPTFHLVRVFIGTDGAGGNPLAVFLDGKAIPPDRRLAVTAELGYSGRHARPPRDRTHAVNEEVAG